VLHGAAVGNPPNPRGKSSAINCRSQRRQTPTGAFYGVGQIDQIPGIHAWIVPATQHSCLAGVLGQLRELISTVVMTDLLVPAPKREACRENKGGPSPTLCADYQPKNSNLTTAESRSFSMRAIRAALPSSSGCCA